MNTKTPIVVGSLVIIDDCDRPYGRLIARVIAVEDDRMRTMYICGDPNMRRYDGASNPISKATVVEDFGIDVEIGTIVYVVSRRKQENREFVESIATYDDGKPRQWQELHGIHTISYPLFRGSFSDSYIADILSKKPKVTSL